MNSFLEDFDVDLNYFNQVYPDIGSDNQSDYYSAERFKNQIKVSPGDVTVLSMNIRSMYGKLDELSVFFGELSCKFDFFCVSETWLNTSTIEMTELENYKHFNIVRENRRGGGVSVFASDKFRSKLLENLSFCHDYLECVFVECKSNSKTIIVGSMYRPPDGDIPLFLISLEDILVNLSNIPNSEIFLCGDFNLNILENIGNLNNVNFINLLSSSSFIPLITKPTRIDLTTNSSTLIDNIFCKNPISYVSGIIVSAISDHYPIFAVYRNFFTDNLINEVASISYRLLNEKTLSSFSSALSEHDFSDIAQLENVDDSFKKFDDVIMHYFNAHCPIVTRTISYKQFTKPWIDRVIRGEIRKREKYLRLYQSGRISEANFKTVRNRVTRMIRDSKKSYFSKKFDEVKGDLKRTWAVINNVLHPNFDKKRGNIDKLNVRDSLISNPHDIANALNNYFSTVGSDIASSFVDPPDHNRFLSGNYLNSFFFSPVSVDDIYEYVSSLKNKKCHINSLPPCVLKKISNIVAPIMCFLINLSISKSSFPECLKVARVVPLFKGGSATELVNYRPISVLHIFAKIIEKHAFKQLYSFLERNSVLSADQFGFRIKRSTTQALLRHLGYIYDNLDDDNLVFSMYLDFKKAFDTVDHNILLSKLYFYGIRGEPYLWFKSYLTGRKQFVSVNGINSMIDSVSHSIPQGSNLGPLLFLVYINDLPNCSRSFKFQMFADDCCISYSVPRVNLDGAYALINSFLENVSVWLCSNKIKINSSKTKYMIYSYRGQYNLAGPIMIGGDLIERVNSVKFLGVVLDDKLRFSEHVLSISSKVSRSIGVLYKLRDFIPTHILRSLYYSMVYPYISYAIEAWFNAPNYISNSVVVLQKRVVRCINFLNYNDHTGAYFKNMRLLPLSSIYCLNISMYMYRTLSDEFYDRELYRKLNTFQDQHDHLTRNRDKYVMPRYRKVKTEANIHHSCIEVWNEMPDAVKSCKSLSTFKLAHKQYLIDSISIS